MFRTTQIVAAKSGGQPAHELAQGFDAGGRRADEDDILTCSPGLVMKAPIVRPSGSHEATVADDTGNLISPGELHQQLLERYAPPSLVVTHEHIVVHMSARVGRYLQVPGGEPTRELLKLVRADLRSDLRSALHQAARDRIAVEVKNLAALLEDGERLIDLTVRPALRDGDPPRGYFLVTFEEKDHEALPAGEARTRATPLDPVTVQLEEELSRIRLQLRNTVEQYETQVEEAKTAHDQTSGLLKRLVTAQEDERARIARDLHDQLGQELTALRLSLQRHRDNLKDRSENDDDLDRALTLADRVNRDLDYLSWELRPAVLDDLGLGAALPLFVREWSEHYRIPAEYQCTAFTAGQLSRDAEVAFYRIAQEALNNVVKHAHASRVDIMLEARDGSVNLVIEDDGIGFDPADVSTHAKGIGIVGMQERASLVEASLQVESAPGEGTSIFLRRASIGIPAAERGE